MPTNDDLTADLRTGVAALRQEFASLSAVSRSFGQDARRSLVGLETETRTATRGARDLGRVFTGALGDIASSGKSLKSVLQSLAVDLAKLATENLLGNGSGGANALTSLLSANANGNGPDTGRIRAFAKGGVLASPALFPMRGGTGLAGEAGPEAIMPLARGADGRLGVAGSGTNNVSVTFNVTAQDVDSFKRSEGQIAALLQRSLNHGARNL